MIRAEELERERRRVAFVEGVRAVLQADRRQLDRDPIRHLSEAPATLERIAALLAVCDGAKP